MSAKSRLSVSDMVRHLCAGLKDSELEALSARSYSALRAAMSHLRGQLDDAFGNDMADCFPVDLTERQIHIPFRIIQRAESIAWLAVQRGMIDQIEHRSFRTKVAAVLWLNSHERPIRYIARRVNESASTLKRWQRSLHGCGLPGLDD